MAAKLITCRYTLQQKIAALHKMLPHNAICLLHFQEWIYARLVRAFFCLKSAISCWAIAGLWCSLPLPRLIVLSYAIGLSSVDTFRPLSPGETDQTDQGAGNELRATSTAQQSGGAAR